MSTQISSIIAQARDHLVEPTPSYWSDDELIKIATRGVQDLWGAIIDLHEDHFLEVDETNVTLAANGGELSGVPTGVFRVLLIEPRDVTDSGSARSVTFEPKAFNHRDFRAARRLSAQDPSGPVTIYYSISKAGAPVNAPTIRVGPRVTSDIELTLQYVPTVEKLMTGDVNPIPGESDNALIAWVVAWARAKERDDRSPDPTWLATYATEKKNLMVRMAPRQEQEPRVVTGMFDDIAYADDDL